MVIDEISNFVSLYIDALSSQLSLHDASYRLSLRQRAWLAFCITGLLFFILNNKPELRTICLLQQLAAYAKNVSNNTYLQQLSIL